MRSLVGPVAILVASLVGCSGGCRGGEGKHAAATPVVTVPAPLDAHGAGDAMVAAPPAPPVAGLTEFRTNSNGRPK